MVFASILHANHCQFGAVFTHFVGKLLPNLCCFHPFPGIIGHYVPSALLGNKMLPSGRKREPLVKFSTKASRASISSNPGQGSFISPSSSASSSDNDSSRSSSPAPVQKKKRVYRKRVNTKNYEKRAMASKKRQKSMPVSGNSKMLKRDVPDPRFQFGTNTVNWTSEISKQPLKNTSIRVLVPKEPLDSDESYLSERVVFDLPQNGQILLPGSGTRLYVEGVFEMKAAGAADWTAVPNSEASKVIVCPNWFEKIMESMELCSSNQTTQKLNRVPSGFSPFLNEMLYAHMDPDLKMLLCKEAAHPGHATTVTRSEWDYTGDAWVKYHPSIFKGGKFNFSYIPLDTWPLFQNGDFVLDTVNPPKAVDLSLFESGKIVIKWNRFACENMFKKKQANTSEYRLRITDLKMAIEIGILNQNDPFPKKSTLGYSGITKIAEQTAVVGNNASVTFSSIKLPTSLLIFFLPQTVLFASSKFQDETEFAGFRKHPLRNIRVKFRDEELYENDPDNKNAHLRLYDASNLEVHWNYPVAGIPIDRQKVTLTNILDDGTNYAFPHAYIRLSPGHHQRLIPANGKINQYQEEGNLEIELKFSANGIVDKSLIVVAYAVYDDYLNVEADLKKKFFYNPSLYNPD